jgi:hypothetical protein
MRAGAWRLTAATSMSLPNFQHWLSDVFKNMPVAGFRDRSLGAKDFKTCVTLFASAFLNADAAGWLWHPNLLQDDLVSACNHAQRRQAFYTRLWWS